MFDLPVLRYINCNDPTNNYKSRYIGILLNDNENDWFGLKPGYKFILFTEYNNKEYNRLGFNSNKLIVKGTDGNEYIEEYKSFYDKYRDIINICIGSLLTIIINLILKLAST